MRESVCHWVLYDKAVRLGRITGCSMTKLYDGEVWLGAYEKLCDGEGECHWVSMTKQCDGKRMCHLVLDEEGSVSLGAL